MIEWIDTRIKPLNPTPQILLWCKHEWNGKTYENVATGEYNKEDERFEDDDALYDQEDILFYAFVNPPKKD
jgi:hypothetical protein